MKIKDYFYDEIHYDKLRLNPLEVADRLGTKEVDANFVKNCSDELKSVLSCKYSAVRLEFNLIDNDVLDIGFGAIKSHSLYRNLNNAEEGFIFVVTLGDKVDKLINRLSIISPAKAFVTDGLASAYAEALADYVDDYLSKGLSCNPRFSPGYGDLSLSVQPDVLNLTNAYKLLNVTLSPNFFMNPTKTITAIKGIKK